MLLVSSALLPLTTSNRLSAAKNVQFYRYSVTKPYGTSNKRKEVSDKCVIESVSQ